MAELFHTYIQVQSPGQPMLEYIADGEGGFSIVPHSDPKRPSLPLVPSCTGCGACCLRMTMPPVMTEYPEDAAWWRNLPAKLQAEIEAVELSELFMEPCIWLDMETRRCRNYEHRPPTCREFVPGCDVCLEDRESARRDGKL